MSFASLSGSVNCSFQTVITLIITLGVILVNGWTDAPNAIASAVCSRAMKPRVAVFSAAFLNFFGVITTSKVNYEVVKTIYSVADFGDNLNSAQTALVSAMFSVVVWAVVAWLFGIPTSESHALIAGLTGSSVALSGNFRSVSSNAWFKAIFGLFFSVVIGFAVAFVLSKVIKQICASGNRLLLNKIFRVLQIFSASSTAFFHGAQDGQKFIGILLLILSFEGKFLLTEITAIPLIPAILCSVIMALGTSMGGKKIMKSVGMEMVSPDFFQGFSADISTSVSLFLSGIFGFPVSTTNVKTSALVGVACSDSLKSVNYRKVKEMLSAWFLTFSLCFILSFAVTKLFLLIFR